MTQYHLGDDYQAKADRYMMIVNTLRDSGVDLLENMIAIQIATECYLCAMLERKTGMSIPDYFEKRNTKLIPHDGSKLYECLFPREASIDPLLGRFNIETKRNLNSMFRDYNAVRFPHDPEKEVVKVVTIEDVDYNYGVLLDVQELCRNYTKAFEEKEQNQQEEEIEK